MGDGEAAASSSPRTEANLPAGSDDEGCNDLYGDFDINAGFVPLLPLSLSPPLSSPPKTPSPGPTPPSPSSPPLFISPPPPSSQPKTPSPGPIPLLSPPPRRSPPQESRPVEPEAEPQPKPSAPQYQPPGPPPAPAAPRHQVTPQPPPRGHASAASSSPSSPPLAALYISELDWWTTDAEVEAALALVPDAAFAPALRGLFFYSDMTSGQSRGVCRADFLVPAAATAAAAALNGRTFHGRKCVASLSRPPAIKRLEDGSNAGQVQAASNPSCGRGYHGPGRGATNAPPVRGILNPRPNFGDRPSLPPRSHGLPLPVGGYGGFQSMGQVNPGMGAGMMVPPPPPPVNSAFWAAGTTGMRGGGFWGAQPPWNVGGYQVPWQLPAPRMQVQQQHAGGDYRGGRGMRGRRLGMSDERGIGNVRHNPERRKTDQDGSDSYKDHDHAERRQNQERAPEKERDPERHHDEGDRRRGSRRRYQEYSDDDDDDRRARSKGRSQSRKDGHDDHPKRHR